MHQTVTAPVGAPVAHVAEIIADLTTYPHWLDLVAAAERTSDGGDELPAWLVTIRAKVGPFARSKKLRMVRTAHDVVDGMAMFRFERCETDGRDHSAWTLDASVGPRAGATTTSLVTMDLRYDGRLWTAPLEPILGSFIDDAGPGLEAYATQG
mgnify:CR=1 FL=1